jgi:FtsH-binding integral membrane protein
MGKQNVQSFDAVVRAGFIRKVYAILSIQLLVTVGGAALFMFHESTRTFVLSTPSMFYTAMFLPIGFIFALMCYKDKHPMNMYILGGFTLCESYTVGVICAMYYANGMGMIVLQALMLTAAIFISLTAYTLTTKKDFSFLGAGLFAGLVVVLMWGMLNMFFDFGIGGRMVFSLIGSLLFAGYILYDTSQIMHNLGPDDYVEAAINLYLDIINLFLYLLEFLRMLQGGND